MVLTSGQTYFYILCGTATVIYTVNWICTLIKIKLVNNSPCKRLKQLEQSYLNLKVEVFRLRKKLELNERGTNV